MEVAMKNIGSLRDAAARTTRAQPRPVAIDSVAWPASIARSPIVTALSSPDFVAIALFCAVGLLATLDLILSVPDIRLS
jgi:hypothetical protein